MVLAALGFVSALLGSSGQGDFWDTPKNHWVFEGISYLKSQGMLVGYPDGLGRGIDVRRSTRYAMAVAYHASAAHLESLQVGLEGFFDKVALDKPGSPEALSDLEKGKDYFTALHDHNFPGTLDYLERGGVSLPRS